MPPILAWRNIAYYAAFLCSLQGAIGGGVVNAASGATSCRCAVLYSGHVRSFVQPRVHLSHKENLIEQLEKDCSVDIFMYISVEDEVPLRYRRGDFGDALFFTPHTPQHAEVDRAVRLLNPVSVEFHQEQAGIIPNGCNDRCEPNAYWQLYKMMAVYRMMKKHETATGLPYTWVIRSRLDIGWMLPLPPLSRFPPSRVYAGHNFFPLADQFLLVPRRYSESVFGAIKLCYDCEVLRAQRESEIPAQTETFLWMALRGDDGSAIVPFGYYEFPVVIVRSNEGGVCEVLHPFKFACEVLRAGGLTVSSPATAGGEDRLGTLGCMNVVSRWHRQACGEMFPPLDAGGLQSDASVIHSDSGGCFREGAVAGAVSGDEKGGAEQRQRLATTGHRGESNGGEAAAVGPAAISRLVVSFEEATERVQDLRRDVSDLLGMMRVNAAPNQTKWPYFMAHHYPFHRVKVSHQAERGLLDYMAIIEGYSLSEADFNLLVSSFSCFLSDFATSASAAGLGNVGVDIATGPPRQDGILVLETTGAAAAAAAQEEELLKAFVNCSSVDPLHDVWLTMLENKFEPSETVCRGAIEPCLNKAWAEVRAS